MKSYALGHLPDHVLLRDLAAIVTHDRATLAELLAHIAEVDTRKLYLPAACSENRSSPVHQASIESYAAGR